ncbi:hypothetical protein [Agromyces sp. M3QZ16-3]|uniref:hypothetical protein n=1 Tax=Agromyces sp. M3QZ16-3 TaxID=3447585 RepID=UPI003F692EB7
MPTEPTTPTPATQPTDASTPPWGDDFDAAKAWNLIQRLRADKAAKQARLDELEASIAQTPKGDVDPVAELRRELYVERALRRFPAAGDLADFLTGETEEEILAKAERLARAGTGELAKPSTELPAKPRAALLPGHGGVAEAGPDFAAIARRARAN